jgi:hypothetical protein
MIHEHNNLFKVTDGKDGSTVHESIDLTDALSCFDYCATEGGLTLVKRRKHATDKHYPISDAVELGSDDFFVGVSGKMVTNVEIRPTTNTPAFILTDGTLRASIEKLLLTHDQSGYTKNLIHIVDSVREVTLSGLRFGTIGSGNFKGNGIGFELFSADKSQYEMVIENIICRDMENAFYFNNQQVDTGTPSEFQSSMVFDKIFPWNCKRVALATGVNGAKTMAIDFDHVHYQYSASNPLATDGSEAVYDFSSALWSWWISLSQCMTWDIPAGSNLANLGSSTDMTSSQSNIPYRVGGSGGISRMKYVGDWRSIGEGKFTTNGIVGQRDYNVSHGLGIAPRFVYVTNISDDSINRQVGCMVPEISIDATKFTVRFADPPVAGTNNVKIHWRAFL